MPSGTTETRGVIYTATGKERYIREAIQSAKSVKHRMDLPTALFTNMNVKDPVFDYVFPCVAHDVPHSQYMLDRLVNFAKTPFDRTLALDTDTFIMEDVSDVFELLGNFDIVLSHGHNRENRHEKAVDAGKIKVPRSFAPVQGGLLLYRRLPKVWSFLEQLVALYKAKQYYDDQVSMRELLFERTDLRIYVLPLEYNFNSEADIRRWEKFDFIEAKPKIFHYTRHKGNWPKVVSMYNDSRGV